MSASHRQSEEHRNGLSACISVQCDSRFGGLLYGDKPQSAFYQFFSSTGEYELFFTGGRIFDLCRQNLCKVPFSVKSKRRLDSLRFSDARSNAKRVLRYRIEEIKGSRFSRLLRIPGCQQFELNFLGHFPLI